MKKFILITSLLVVNIILAQKPIFNNMPTKVLTAPVKTNATSSLTLKRITPASGSVTNFRMVKGTGTTSENKTTPIKKIDENGRYCTTVTIDASKGYDEQLVLGNQNDKIYPGAIYYDNAFISGTYNAPLNLNLQPYNITTSLSSSASTGSSAVQVTPSMSGVKDGIATLMRRNTRVINSALGGFEVKQISSLDQLAFELGAGFQGYGVDLNAQFNYLNEKRKNVYFAKLTQVYFDVNTDIQNPKNLIAATDSNTNLVYINKVSYGRIAIIQVSSDYSKEEIQAALNFSYTGSNYGANVNANIDYKKIQETSEIKGLFFGGDATNTVPVTSFDQLKSFNDYIRNGLRWNSAVVPTPVSYQLKYLNDNSVASTQATTRFNQINCQSGSGVKIKLHGIAIDDTDNTCGCAWGTISVKLWETNENGDTVKEIMPKANVGSEYWNAPGNNPTRVLKFSELRQKDPNNSVNMEQFDAIDIEKVYSIDPEVYAKNRVQVEFIMQATTDHKDNDFASQGIHGMSLPVTKKLMLKDLVTLKQTIQTDKLIYTYKLGGFQSNTNRNKVFNALFTITPND